jgi:hypothetical protein
MQISILKLQVTPKTLAFMRSDQILNITLKVPEQPMQIDGSYRLGKVPPSWRYWSDAFQMKVDTFPGTNPINHDTFNLKPI